MASFLLLLNGRVDHHLRNYLNRRVNVHFLFQDDHFFFLLFALFFLSFRAFLFPNQLSFLRILRELNHFKVLGLLLYFDFPKVLLYSFIFPIFLKKTLILSRCMEKIEKMLQRFWLLTLFGFHLKSCLIFFLILDQHSRPNFLLPLILHFSLPMILIPLVLLIIVVFFFLFSLSRPLLASLFSLHQMSISRFIQNFIIFGHILLFLIEFRHLFKPLFVYFFLLFSHLLPFDSRQRSYFCEAQTRIISQDLVSLVSHKQGKSIFWSLSLFMVDSFSIDSRSTKKLLHLFIKFNAFLPLLYELSPQF